MRNFYKANHSARARSWAFREKQNAKRCPRSEDSFNAVEDTQGASSSTWRQRCESAKSDREYSNRLVKETLKDALSLESGPTSGAYAVEESGISHKHPAFYDVESRGFAKGRLFEKGHFLGLFQRDFLSSQVKLDHCVCVFWSKFMFRLFPRNPTLLNFLKKPHRGFKSYQAKDRRTEVLLLLHIFVFVVRNARRYVMDTGGRKVAPPRRDI